MTYVDLKAQRLVLKVLLAGPPSVGKSERLWQLGHAAGERRVLEFGRTPLGPQRMARLDLDVEGTGRPVSLEAYEWHGPERADVRGRGLFSGLDGLVYLADARTERQVDTTRQCEFLVSELGRSRARRLPALLVLGRKDEGGLRLEQLERRLPELAWTGRVEALIEETEDFLEGVRALGQAMLLRPL